MQMSVVVGKGSKIHTKRNIISYKNVHLSIYQQPAEQVAF